MLIYFLGMWGGMNRDLNVMLSLRELLVKDASQSFSKDFDQQLLTKHVYPVVLKTSDYIDHNSYLCTKYFSSVPWPTKRKSRNEFVGKPSLMNYTYVMKECPQICRPKNHSDWTYC